MSISTFTISPISIYFQFVTSNVCGIRAILKLFLLFLAIVKLIPSKQIDPFSTMKSDMLLIFSKVNSAESFCLSILINLIVVSTCP